MSSTVLDTGWQRVAEGLDETNLRALMAGEVAALRIADFATPKECAAFCDAIRQSAGATREAETARMTLIGVNFSNYAGQSKKGYFEQVQPSYDGTAAITERAASIPCSA